MSRCPPLLVSRLHVCGLCSCCCCPLLSVVTPATTDADVMALIDNRRGLRHNATGSVWRSGEGKHMGHGWSGALSCTDKHILPWRTWCHYGCATLAVVAVAVVTLATGHAISSSPPPPHAPCALINMCVSHCCAAVYDVTQRETLEGLRRVWLGELTAFGLHPDTAYMLVGNKVDQVRTLM